MRTKVQGWTIVHSTRTRWQGEYDGVFLGERDGAWIAGRMYTGKSMDDGFFGEQGEWWYASYYDLPGHNSTDNAENALNRYIAMAKDAGNCWNSIFAQRAGEAVDRYWAGPEVPGAPRLAAGWCRTPGGLPAGTTVPMPLHEARYNLLQYLRATKSSARPEGNPRAFVLHDTVELIRQTTGPFRIQYGINAYWLDTDMPATAG